MDYGKTARKFRKQRLFDFSSASTHRVSYNRQDIMKILPHRDPLLLVDSIDAIDLPSKCIMGRRVVHEKDPIFKGHFPRSPIYPGVLHVEMAGQLGLCLHHFLQANSSVLAAKIERVEVRLLKILHVFFQYEVLPGDNLTVVCMELESDAYKSTGIGQIMKDERVCTVSIAEFYQI